MNLSKRFFGLLNFYKTMTFLKAWNFRSSLSQMFFKISVLKYFSNSQESRPYNFIKKRLQHRCFPAKFAKLLSTPSFTEHLWWLLFGFQEIDTRPFWDSNPRPRAYRAHALTTELSSRTMRCA